MSLSGRMTEEVVDIFDAELNPIAPYEMGRKETHVTGEWHQTFDCWVLRRDPSGDKIVMQLRSTQKPSYPNTLDTSAAGHLLAGETLEDGVREVEEELGLKVAFEELYYLGLLKEAIDVLGRRIRHLSHTYFYETKLPLSAYKLQETEVDGVFEVNIADGLKYFNGETSSFEGVGLVKGEAVTRQFTKKDMAAFDERCRVTRYYLKIFVLADLYLKGQRPLVI